MRWIAFAGIVLGFGALFRLISALMKKTTGGTINAGSYGAARHVTTQAFAAKQKPPKARKHH